jgi:prepilin-type processing-associated H-X9-DG protein
MPIQFSCPFCGETTLVDEPFAGHTGPCVNCGKLVTVPSARNIYSLQSAVQGMRRANWQAALIIGLFLVGLGIALYAFYQSIGRPALIAASQVAAKQKCQGNLRRIGQALMAYEEANGSFPPAYTVDAAGKPLHSWRVLILPYLGPQEKAIYQQINLNEAWNSPVNSTLHGRMPKVFASPLDANANSLQESSYRVIIGPKTMFPDAIPPNGPGSRKRSEITDDLSSTILVVEKESNGNSWMDPNDGLTDGQIDYQIGGDLGGNHNRGATFLFADGIARFLSDITSSEDLESMTTVAGNEAVDLPGD